ncbi:hypothetical protein FFLO_00617 [Filobasidium floriforme]|uniref:Mitochondrial glyco protein n=1 Tax=Filobasidium floriforme TaxID=5210 RepID=A0A8K0NVJ5_9TREE|nr:hypothetical protein FFLO_00617 [Filobasidium floriforme]
MAARTIRTSLAASRTIIAAARPAIRPVLARAAWVQPISRTFTASSARLDGGETDAALSAKLQEELNFEKDSQAAMAGQEPEWLEEFNQNGVWAVNDRVGNGEVVLTRSFGNEKLKLTFSIEDLDNPPDTSDLTPSEGEGEEAENTFPIRCSLSITKPSGGSLVMDLLVENEAFVIDSAQFYSDAKLAEDMTAEGDWKRRATYVGPRFDHLDSTVQTEFENYLDERAINQNLALFIPLYCEYKEQKEYMTWLEKVKRFIDQ